MLYIYPVQAYVRTCPSICLYQCCAALHPYTCEAGATEEMPVYTNNIAEHKCLYSNSKRGNRTASWLLYHTDVQRIHGNSAELSAGAILTNQHQLALSLSYHIVLRVYIMCKAVVRRDRWKPSLQLHMACSYVGLVHISEIVIRAREPNSPSMGLSQRTPHVPSWVLNSL